MKNYIINYVAVTEGFASWTTLDFVNESDFEDEVQIKIRRANNGTISDTIVKNILPRCHEFLTAVELAPLMDINGRASLLITCGDNTFITPANNWGAVIIPREVDGFD